MFEIVTLLLAILAPWVLAPFLLFLCGCFSQFWQKTPLQKAPPKPATQEEPLVLAPKLTGDPEKGEKNEEPGKDVPEIVVTPPASPKTAKLDPLSSAHDSKKSVKSEKKSQSEKAQPVSKQAFNSPAQQPNQGDRQTPEKGSADPPKPDASQASTNEDSTWVSYGAPDTTPSQALAYPSLRLQSEGPKGKKFRVKTEAPRQVQTEPPPGALHNDGRTPAVAPVKEENDVAPEPDKKSQEKLALKKKRSREAPEKPISLDSPPIASDKAHSAEETSMEGSKSDKMEGPKANLDESQKVVKGQPLDVASTLKTADDTTDGGSTSTSAAGNDKSPKDPQKIAVSQSKAAELKKVSSVKSKTEKTKLSGTVPKSKGEKKGKFLPPDGQAEKADPADDLYGTLADDLKMSEYQS